MKCEDNLENMYAYSPLTNWRKVMPVCSGVIKFFPYIKTPQITNKNNDHVKKELEKLGYTVKCVDYPNLTYSQVIDILKSSS